ncbi:MAG TPA: hypothetical protein VIJ99_00700, partial [Acidimicrobiales bacterium]
MTSNDGPRSTNSSVTDVLLLRRPLWQSFIGGVFIDDDTEAFEVLEAATAAPLARVAIASDEIV